MLPINIGIDFGTSYSKICVRGPTAIGSAICTFGDDLPSDALILSRLWVSEDGTVTLPWDGTDLPAGAMLEYPKMALADLKKLKVSGASADLEAEIEELIEPLCALYLAHLLRMAKRWVYEHWRAYTGEGDDIEWSANVGVPVAYLNSEAEATFARVLAVAWDWMCFDHVPETLDEARIFYAVTSGEIDPSESPCQPFPEIGAAVQAFVSSREARPGIYVFFDIGGGTVDGVAFNFRRVDGLPIVDFYSGEVGRLGVRVFSEWISKLPEFEKAISENTLEPVELAANFFVGPERAEIPYRDQLSAEIRKLVAKVVVTAKQKDPRNWRSDLIQATDLPRPYFLQVTDEDVRPLTVFMGGGGFQSEFYCEAISSTYSVNQHRGAGIPPYALTPVPRPLDMDLGGIADDDFHRFLIAYGLSVPFGEGAEVNLPSQFDKVELRRPTKVMSDFSYADTKDMFD